jgi:CRP-like cAMP-binding protein
MSEEECTHDPVQTLIRQFLADKAEDSSIFHFMDHDELEFAADYFEVVCYPVGSVIAKEGEKLDYLGIVTSGKLEARHKPTIGSREITIALLEKGAHFGTISFPGGRSAMATVVAEEETEVLVLSQEKFNAFADRQPTAAVRLLQGIIEVLTIRLESAIDRVILFY